MQHRRTTYLSKNHFPPRCFDLLATVTSLQSSIAISQPLRSVFVLKCLSLVAAPTHCSPILIFFRYTPQVATCTTTGELVQLAGVSGPDALKYGGCGGAAYGAAAAAAAAAGGGAADAAAAAAAGGAGAADTGGAAGGAAGGASGGGARYSFRRIITLP